MQGAQQLGGGNKTVNYRLSSGNNMEYAAMYNKTAAGWQKVEVSAVEENAGWAANWAGHNAEGSFLREGGKVEWIAALAHIAALTHIAAAYVKTPEYMQCTAVHASAF